MAIVAMGSVDAVEEYFAQTPTFSLSVATYVYDIVERYGVDIEPVIHENYRRRLARSDPKYHRDEASAIKLMQRGAGL